MEDLLIVIFFSLVGGVFSLIGGFLLLAHKRHAKRLLRYVTPFAAGALLAAAFIDVLPDAAHHGDIEQALRWTMIGILVFFLLERFLRWFHHHSHDEASEQTHKDATVPLIITGDLVHNFIDGIAIAAAFLIDVPTGIVVTAAIAMHEIPQEIGDFGLLLEKGMSRKNVVVVNVLSALATTVAAVTFYVFGEQLQIPFGMLLGLVAGFFIYIAVSDIIPHIHKSEGQRLATAQTAMLIGGAVLVGMVTTTLHDIIDAKSHEHSHEVHQHTAMNTWASPGASKRDPSLGLGEVRLVLPDDGSIDRLANRLTDHRLDFRQKGDDLFVSDPWNNQLRFTTT